MLPRLPEKFDCVVTWILGFVVVFIMFAGVTSLAAEKFSWGEIGGMGFIVAACVTVYVVDSERSARKRARFEQTNQEEVADV